MSDNREAEWAKAKAYYDSPYSIIEMGEIYWWADYWFAQWQAALSRSAAALAAKDAEIGRLERVVSNVHIEKKEDGVYAEYSAREARGSDTSAEQRKFIESLGFDPDNLPTDEVEHYEQCLCCGNFARMEAKHDSAVELVRELVLRAKEMETEMEYNGFTLTPNQSNAITKAAQWLKNRGE